MENFGKSKAGGRFEGGRTELRGDTFEKNDAPATDSFDDGLGVNGKVVMPGSTSVEGGGTYMEHTGPNDLRHKVSDGDAALGELDPEISIREGDDVDGPAGTIDDESKEFTAEDDKEDAAAKWLRENDPDLQ